MTFLKGIVSWNRMTIWQFYRIAGNLIICWRILNFKILNFYFKNFKTSVSPLRSFGGTCHWQGPLRWEYFSPRRKILSPYGKSANSISKFVFSRFSYGEKLVWGVQAKEIRKKYIPYWDKILRRGEKYSRRNGTCQWQVLQNARSGET
jgi:hypothetical protein